MGRKLLLAGCERVPSDEHSWQCPEGTDLSGEDLSYSVIKNSTFTNVDFSGADFRHSNLETVQFLQSSLAQAKL